MMDRDQRAADWNAVDSRESGAGGAAEPDLAVAERQGPSRCPEIA
jgi:hypothetical protein